MGPIEALHSHIRLDEEERLNGPMAVEHCGSKSKWGVKRKSSAAAITDYSKRPTAHGTQQPKVPDTSALLMEGYFRYTVIVAVQARKR